jgi:transcriptional repressor NrdR
VVKRSGATEPFSRTKVIDGVRKACEGRPVSEDALALLAQQVEETVRGNGCAEIPAHEVGLAILPPLRGLDEVAYMRFASVYRSFSSLSDFEAEIAELRAHQSLHAASVQRFGGAHDPAPPPVHETVAVP